MNPDEIIEKAQKGELSDEEIERLNSTLTDDEKKAITAKASEDFKTTLSSLSAIRKEKNRVEDLAKKALEDQAKVETKAAEVAVAQNNISQFRQEQIGKAKEKFVADFKITPEQLPAIEAIFAKLDSGAIDADLVYKDLVSAYGAVNSSSLVDAERAKNNLEKGAIEETINAAGTHQAPPGGEPEKPKFSENVKKLAQEAGITEEAAHKVATEGMSRTY